ncbi:DEAD box RNA helicase family protein [Actinidia rufa]|uniref:RNA helicase n=1 Tax=Actinidia rufa TaxID=165716 RepID=A0A7J0DA85_9ERIC|nr:DEAD box RNA helicase family protein [Actinidia rufa]
MACRFSIPTRIQMHPSDMGQTLPAMEAGLPFLNPYKNTDAYFRHGANFVVAGSTALPVEVLARKNISTMATSNSFSVQLDWMGGHCNFSNVKGAQGGQCNSPIEKEGPSKKWSIFSPLLCCGLRRLPLFSLSPPSKRRCQVHEIKALLWHLQLSLSAAPCYAPEDPSLPKSWRGLVDGKTDYLYFWNPETNVTQYERPIAPLKLSAPLSSSVQVPQSSQGKRHDNSYNDDSDRYSRGSKLSGQARLAQGGKSGSDHSYNVPNGGIGTGHGASFGKGHGPSDVENGPSAESYHLLQSAQCSINYLGYWFSPEILRKVHQAGFSAPTPIHAQSWPIALQSRDIVAIAKTGSGKTLGYLIPWFIHVKRRRSNPQLGPTILVLSPTRELATQIEDKVVKFGKSSKICCTTRKIVKEVPTRRQTLVYIATWPKEVRKIATDLLVYPVQVNIGNVDKLVANKAITQNVELLVPMEKHRRLEQILQSQEPGSKIIIFCSTKKMCDQLSGNLTRHFVAAAIHGDKSQGERDHVLNQFWTGRSPVLVATDVAAHGLDIKDIRVVINYDFPTGVEDNVHRIGRTGRAGATGLAYTFFGDQDAKHASDLIKILEGANQHVPPELHNVASRGGGMGRARRPWGSGSGGQDAGRGGRNDTGYGGRDGGRGSWGIPERGSGRGFDRDSRDRYRHNFNESVEGSGSYHNRSFHESMVHAGGGARQSRSPNKVSGWGDHRSNKARSCSRSPGSRDPEKGFKNFAGPESRPPEISRSPADYHRRENLRESDDDAPKEWGKAPNVGKVTNHLHMDLARHISQIRKRRKA